MQANLSPFGIILRKYRKANKLTLRELGEELQMTQSFLSSIVRGHKPVPQKLLDYVLFRVPTCQEEHDTIVKAADYQAKEIRLNIELLDVKRKYLALDFKRKLFTLNLQQINSIMKVLKKET